MTSNKLKLNDDKTEVLLIRRKEQCAKISITSIKIGNCNVSTTTSARIISVIQDQELCMKDQVSSICRSAYFHLRNIGQLRKYLDKKATEAIIHAFVSSRLDNGNALLYGLPKSQISRLQRIQNTAALILLRLKKYDHISHHLKCLHWLSVKASIEFKILLFTYKSLHVLAPMYLRELLTPYMSCRDSRLNYQGLLQIPQTRLMTCGDKAFSKIAPKLWHGLPNEIRNKSTVAQFKVSLKTFLYNKHCD
jgi:hypothetical protein